jgi:hypothetical protein
LQEEAANHRKVRRSRAGVLSVAGKGRTLILSGMGQEGERKRTPDEVSKCLDDIETEESTQLWDEVWGPPVYCPRGVRHKGGASLALALVWNMGTCHSGSAARSTGQVVLVAERGRTSSRRNGEGESTVTENRDGPSRSSDDIW